MKINKKLRMSIVKGDKVAVIDDVLKGTVVKVTKSKVTFKDNEGFLFDFSPNELVVIRHNQADLSKFININNEEFNQKLQNLTKKKKSLFKTDSKDKIPVMEVDLHINRLVKSTKNMDNFDMLTLQLNTAKYKIEFAIKKRISKVVFIHGVGEGVLKIELENLLKKYPVKWYPASFQKYGLGATEVYIFQNNS